MRFGLGVASAEWFGWACPAGCVQAMKAKIRRFRVATWTVDLDIPISLNVESMTVPPGLPGSIVVTFYSGGTVVFDGAQQRDGRVSSSPGPDFLTGGPNASTIFGYDGSGTVFRLGLSPSGVTVASKTSMSLGFELPVYAGGLLYLGDAAIDPVLTHVAQTFGISGIMGPFPALNKILILKVGNVLNPVNLGEVLALVDVTTGGRIWTQTIPALPSDANGIRNDPMITWGTNGVAFRDGNGVFSPFDAPAIQLFRVNVDSTAASPFFDSGLPPAVRRQRRVGLRR